MFIVDKYSIEILLAGAEVQQSPTFSNSERKLDIVKDKTKYTSSK